MQNTIILFETAKLAKEKRFNIPVINYINPNGTSDCIKPTTYYGRDGINELGGQQLIDYNNTIIDICELETYLLYYNEEGKQENYSAPTQSLLQKWLRETHDIIVLVNTDCIKELDNHKRYLFNVDIKRVNFSTITKGDRYDHGDDSGYNTYEEALECGLQTALNLIN